MAAPGSSSYAPVFSTQHSKTTARKVRENLFGFSRTCRAVVAGSCGMQDACVEELEAGAAVHGSLGGLDSVDLPLCGACGPR